MTENQKIKIKISNNAYDFFKQLLNFHDEYDCIALQENLSTKCCKSPKIEVSLSNIKNFSHCTSVEGITFCYNLSIINNIKEITMVLKDSTIHVNVSTLNDAFTNANCGGCGKNKNTCRGCK